MNLNNNNMTEIQRTDLLNYLNNNKITYLFDSSNQTIIVNLVITFDVYLFMLFSYFKVNYYCLITTVE